jgi:predicted alpha/beta hydrolase family esterase
MTRQVLFVQGFGADVHDEWDSKLVASLERHLGAGYDIRYPRMPNEADPRYGAWKPVLLKELASLSESAIVVGHSGGGAILINTLADVRPTTKLAGIFLLAAPFIGDGGWPSDDIKTRTDLSERVPTGVPIFLYHGTADQEVPLDHVRLYAAALPRAVVRTLNGSDHQLHNDLSQVARDIRSLT